MLSDRDANLAQATWRVLRNHFHLKEDRREDAARGFVGQLFRVAFAILHAPAYQAEHKSALSSDWAHLPIPKDPNLFERLVIAGDQVTRLLDAANDATTVIQTVLGAVQRVAALLALGPTLDSLYQEAAANAFTADELQITR